MTIRKIEIELPSPRNDPPRLSHEPADGPSFKGMPSVGQDDGDRVATLAGFHA
jgi:hypothetical protein